MLTASNCVSTSEVIQALIASTQSVFTTMLGSQIRLVDCCTLGKFQSANDLTGMVGLSGEITGTVLVRLDQSVAIGVAQKLLGSEIIEVDNDVRDMTGELASLIAGDARQRITDVTIALSLPTIISGPGHRISFEPGADVQRICFQSEWGPVCVEAGIRS
jgi:chemotaxis protein CheX